MDRAYSLLEIRSVDEELRVIEGIATTPKVDRMGDVVDPMGVTAAKEIPLLLFHDTQRPVGTVRLGKATKAGIPFRAQIPKVIESGILRDRVDEAWQSVKYRVIAATSIGFRVLDDAVERIETGLKFLKTEVLELSLVPIPAQDEAVITAFKAYCFDGTDDAVTQTIKSFDDAQQAATGQELSADEPGPEPEPAKPPVRVVRLNDPARARAPFVIREIKRVQR